MKILSITKLAKSVPKIIIKPKEPVAPVMKITAKKNSTQGAEIIAEQNKVIINQGNTTPKRITVKGVSKENTLYDEFNRLMNNGSLNLEKAKEIEKLFLENTKGKGDTGVKLYCPSNSVEGSFYAALIRIIDAVKDGTFPKEIKHVLIGHGIGSTLLGPRSWQMSGPSVKDGKYIEIFDFVNKLKLPKNEPVLVLCCEDGIKSVLKKPGIGMQVDLSLSNLGGYDKQWKALMGPGKIVRSGENKICGHFTLLDKDSGGGLVYYDKDITA